MRLRLLVADCDGGHELLILVQALPVMIAQLGAVMLEGPVKRAQYTGELSETLLMCN